MRVINCQQGDATWFHERVGRVTASRVADAISFTQKGKPSAAREKYKMELLQEIITGEPVEHYVTAEMQFGIENEPLARTAYEMEKAIDVERVGLVVHPRIDRAAASPDGLVGTDGLVEFKVPQTLTHLQYVLDGVAPEQYQPQMLWQMACTGRQWCDFVSYDPRLPEDFGLFIVRFYRDEKLIADMEAKVSHFTMELNAMCEKLLKHRTLESQLRESVARASVPRAELPEMT